MNARRPSQENTMSWFSRWFDKAPARRAASARRARLSVETLGGRLVPSATLSAHADGLPGPPEPPATVVAQTAEPAVAAPVAAVAHGSGLQDVFWSATVVSLLGPVDARASFARPLAPRLGAVASADVHLVDEIFIEEASKDRPFGHRP
jgi:hypothetical protein